MALAPARRARLQARAVQLLLLGVLVGVWAWAASGGRVSPILLAPPHDVAARVVELVQEAHTWRQVRITATEILWAFVLSATTGLAVGIAVGRSRYLRDLLEPVLIWFQTVPIILVYPVCVLVLGLGPGSKIAFAGIYGFFPIAFNTMRGFASVDRRHLDAARSMGASRVHTELLVRLPAARPMTMAGIRLGASLNIVGVIAGEILASTGGLGYQIFAASQRFRVADLYAYLVIALVLVVLLNAAIGGSEVSDGPRGRTARLRRAWTAWRRGDLEATT